MANCESCRFWSEMVAQSKGYEIEALCLNPQSPFRMKYTMEKNGCKQWRENIFGAVDEPGIEEMYFNDNQPF